MCIIMFLGVQGSHGVLDVSVLGDYDSHIGVGYFKGAHYSFICTCACVCAFRCPRYLDSLCNKPSGSWYEQVHCDCGRATMAQRQLLTPRVEKRNRNCIKNN